MIYNVKIPKKELAKLQELIGSAEGTVNLATGVISVHQIESVAAIAEKLEVENVNFEALQKFVEVQVAAKNSLKSRKKIVGEQFVPGAIVRIKAGKNVEHLMIIGSDESTYTAVKVDIRENKETSKNSNKIPMRKGEDVIFINLTYKDVVTLVNEVHKGLTEARFIKNSGATIVGRVVNEKILERATSWTKNV